MELENWTVMAKEDTKRHDYFYGPLEDYELEEYEGFVEVPYEEWSASDFAEILGNILEDRNHHWMVDIPHMLLEILEEAKLKEPEKCLIMKRFTECLENEKFR